MSGYPASIIQTKLLGKKMKTPSTKLGATLPGLQSEVQEEGEAACDTHIRTFCVLVPCEKVGDLVAKVYEVPEAHCDLDTCACEEVVAFLAAVEVLPCSIAHARARSRETITG